MQTSYIYVSFRPLFIVSFRSFIRAYFIHIYVVYNLIYYLICLSILFAFYCAHYQSITYYFQYLLHFCLVVTKVVVCLQCRNNQTLVLYSTNEKKGIVYLCVIYPYGNIMLTQTKMRLCRTGRGMPNSLTYWNYFLSYLINEKR
jgi:hypothetical protein